jgi:hypothetical protein
MNSKLLCYAYGHGNSWEAICVDFDLAVQGQSFEDVQERLNKMIRSYILDARQEDDQTASRLLNRRAPFSLRIKLAAKLLWNIVSNRGSKNGDYYAGYDVPCHA